MKKVNPLSKTLRIFQYNKSIFETKLFTRENNRCRIKTMRNIFAATKEKKQRGASVATLLSAGRDKETDFKGFFANGEDERHVPVPIHCNTYLSPRFLLMVAAILLPLMKLSISIRPTLFLAFFEATRFVSSQ